MKESLNLEMETPQFKSSLINLTKYLFKGEIYGLITQSFAMA